MSAGLLHLHNALRWVILIAGLIAVVKAVMNLAANKPYSKAPGTVFVASLHVQLILGFILYGAFSGLAQQFRAMGGAAMKDAVLRFWGMEHLVMMLIAVVLATIGSARARRAPTDAAKNRTARLFFAIALVVLLAGIPWPFRQAGIARGLFPGMSAPAATATTTPTTPPTTGEAAAPPPPVG